MDRVVDTLAYRWRDLTVRATGPRAGWRRRQAARRLARAGTPDAARGLAEVFLGTEDARVRRIARRALSTLVDQAARDAACEVALATGDERLWTLLTDAGYLPSDPERRAVWSFMAGQDVDTNILRAAFRGADAGLRRRIADRARVAGRAEWIRAVAAEAGSDWDTTLPMLIAARRWGEVWRLVTSAPLPWAARMLSTLEESGWRPETGAEHDAYRHLTALAKGCASAPSATTLFEEPRVLAERESQYANTMLALSQRGDFLARLELGGGAKQGLVWRLPSGEMAGEFMVRETSPRALAVSPDGTAVAIADYDGTVRVQGLSVDRTVYLTASVGSRARECRGVAFTPDGEWLVGVGAGGLVWLWHVPTGKRVWADMASSTTGGDLSISAGGRLLAVHGDLRGVRDQPHVRLWCLPSGEPAGTVDCAGPGRVESMMMTPDGRRLIAAGRNQAQMWELPSRRQATTWRDLGGPAAMSADGQLVAFPRTERRAVAHSIDTIEVRRTADGELVTAVDQGRLADEAGETRFAVSRDGRLLATTCERPGRVRLWHLPSGASAGPLIDNLGDRVGGRATLVFAAGDALLAWGRERVLLWRPEPVLLGRVPVGEVGAAEAERLRDLTRPGADRPWGALLAALVDWRRRLAAPG